MINYREVLFSLILTGCISTSSTQDVYVELSDKITAQYIKHVRKDGKFTLIGTGGRITDEVQIVYLTFHTVATLDIPAARKIIIEKEEEFLDRLNGMPEIRPYLIHYPSGAKSLELSIGFKNSKGLFVSPPHIALVSVFNGEISYDTFEVKNRSFTTVFSEPYEEGYKIVYGREKE